MLEVPQSHRGGMGQSAKIPCCHHVFVVSYVAETTLGEVTPKGTAVHYCPWDAQQFIPLN